MKRNIILCLLIRMSLTIAIISGYIGLTLAESHKEYCYDQIGDSQICFETQDKCIEGQQRDDIPESSCYAKDS
jgi:hypothetical protein